MLRDYECVELVRTEPRRGALQHFYKATARPNLDEGQWRTLPSGLRRELTGETIQELVNDLAQAADAGTLEDPEVVLTRTPLELDEKGWKKLNKLLAQDARSGARDRGRELGPPQRRHVGRRVPDRGRDPALPPRPAGRDRKLKPSGGIVHAIPPGASPRVSGGVTGGPRGRPRARSSSR